MSRTTAAFTLRPLGLLAPPLLAGLMACSAPNTPPASTATVKGQVIVPSAFLPSGTSLADVYAKTRVWLYDANNMAVRGAAVDASGAYTLDVPASISGQRLVAVIGSGSVALGLEASMVPLAATSAHLDITLQSTVDTQYASDPVLKASFDSTAAAIWQNAFAAQNIAPVDPSKVPAGALLLTGPDLSGDPSDVLLGSQSLNDRAGGVASQGFFDGVGNFFGGVVHSVAGAVQGTVSAVTGGVSYVFNGLKDAIAGVTTPQEPRLIVDFDNSAKKLVLTGIGGRLISQDGGGLISQDGGGLIGQDGGGLISQDGGGIVATGGGNVVSNDGGSLTGSGLRAQATTFATTPVGGVARFMGSTERCVSATNQITCVLVGKLLTAAVGEKAAVAIADAAMQTGNLRIGYTLAELLNAAQKRAALTAALQTPASTTAPAAPVSIAASPARASNQKPLASIALRAGSGGSGTVPYTETYDASASRDPDGSVSLYEWNFGDGSPLLRLSPSSGTKLSHTFTRAGNFTTTLTVYDNAGGQSDAATQAITVYAPTALPVIGDPSPATLKLNAVVGAAASGTVQYSNLGGGTLNADANPSDGWLSVVSNTPRPLVPGATATVTLKATCPASAGTLNTSLILTANDSRVPRKTVAVTLTCTAATLPLDLGVTRVGNQSVPPYGTASNPAVVAGKVSVSGYVQAGGSRVNKVQVLLVGNPTPVSEQAVSVAAGARQDDIGQANLDTTLLSNGTYSFFVRATDDSGASADSATVTVLVNNTSTAPTQRPAASEITQVGSAPVSPGQSAVTVSGSVNVFARLYGGSNGYNGNVYLCFQRSENTAVAVQAANIQANAVYDFGYTWDSRSVSNTPTGSADHLYLSGSQKCDDISNPATTSVISINVSN